MKNNRSSHQTARKGWKPRQTSDRQLAMDIIASIQTHKERGIFKTACDYTQRDEVIHLVESMQALAEKLHQQYHDKG